MKEDYDGAEPAASSIALANLWRLAGLTSGEVGLCWQVVGCMPFLGLRNQAALHGPRGGCAEQYGGIRSSLPHIASTALRSARSFCPRSSHPNASTYTVAGGGAVAGEGGAVCCRLCGAAVRGGHRAASNGVWAVPADAGAPSPGGCAPALLLLCPSPHAAPMLA